MIKNEEMKENITAGNNSKPSHLRRFKLAYILLGIVVVIGSATAVGIAMTRKKTPMQKQTSVITESVTDTPVFEPVSPSYEEAPVHAPVAAEESIPEAAFVPAPIAQSPEPEFVPVHVPLDPSAETVRDRLNQMSFATEELNSMLKPFGDKQPSLDDFEAAYEKLELSGKYGNKTPKQMVALALITMRSRPSKVKKVAKLLAVAGATLAAGTGLHYGAKYLNDPANKEMRKSHESLASTLDTLDGHLMHFGGNFVSEHGQKAATTAGDAYDFANSVYQNPGQAWTDTQGAVGQAARSVGTSVGSAWNEAQGKVGQAAGSVRASVNAGVQKVQDGLAGATGYETEHQRPVREEKTMDSARREPGEVIARRGATLMGEGTSRMSPGEIEKLRTMKPTPEMAISGQLKGGLQNRQAREFSDKEYNARSWLGKFLPRHTAPEFELTPEQITHNDAYSKDIHDLCSAQKVTGYDTCLQHQVHKNVEQLAQPDAPVDPCLNDPACFAM